ncbi:MAG: hypothetical protein COX90_03985 [Candidatus Nealsonbacteria bacterium CG_4_10_14_0_2_um_filter_38_17]|uniref:Uncharacterized protein n=2 Tax=Candidatus Nealsoniibacteriota TaxID=1817911 RepID=A0A2M7UX50_9BACT|nr:MAG: hypothetical protein COX36_04500 [Candidatus Nealsonbacteria bacterium CG23_combo_of_CG06-09_8_20_14_all_38_19]PIZ88542.1 MAG: hypothetical protein COX90_03985 [Candidatus Nealsonbacteria bacterium CG_4_10_14_0_2_um_filter_38_17]
MADTNNQQQNSISDIVLNKIKSGGVKMRPKIYFVLKTILIIFGTAVLTLLILFLVSFIVFAMRASGTLFLPSFGVFGLRILFISLPWFLIFATVISVILMEILAKHFAIVYRRPIVYSILFIIILVLLGGIIIERTRFHPSLFWRSQEKRLPIMGGFYRDPSITRLQNVHRGIISEITSNGFLIKKPDNQMLTIIVTPDTQFLPGREIKEGEAVVVMGRREDDTVYAFGIRRIEDQFNMFMLEHRPPRPMR